MDQKLGIENLKKLIDLGLEIEDLVSKLVKNGANWQNDIPELFAKVPVLIAHVQAIAAAGAQIPLEMKDLDGEEALALVAHVADKLTLDNAKAQAVVKASLKLAAHMIADGIDLAKAIRQ